MADDVRVIHGDCLDVLRSLPDESVDCVVTDPPYSEIIHAGARSFVATGRTAHKGFAVGEASKSLVDFDSIDGDSFVSMVGELLRVCRRWVVLTCDWRHLAAAEIAGLPLVQRGVWIKPDAAPQFSGDRPSAGWEAVGMFHNPGKKRWNGGGRSAVWTCGRDRSKSHPSVKPLALVRQWVELFSDPGDLILDPFAGSGTTGVACLKAGRRCILIEKDARYIPVIERRIAEAETPLFQGIAD